MAQITIPDNKYYCYRHIRPDKNVPFYVGVGTKSNKKHISFKSEYQRAFDLRPSRRTTRWVHIFNKNNQDIIVEILYETSTLEVIKLKEKEFIFLYGRVDLQTGTLVNLTDGGDGAEGYKHTCEAKHKLSKALTGRLVKPETNLKNSIIRKGIPTGRKLSEDHKQKLIATCKGIPKPQAYRDKISNTLKGRYLEGDNPRSVPIVQLTKSGEFVKEWSSIIGAERFLKINNITAVLIGDQKHCGGFKWVYKKDYKR